MAVLILADPNAAPVNGSFSSAGLRKIQAVVLSIALAVAATAVTVPAEKGLVWLRSSILAKIDPGLDRTAGEPASVIVQAESGAADAAAAAVETAGGTVGAPLPVVGGFEATVPGRALPDLADSSAVRSVTANRTGRFSQLQADDATMASTFPSSTGATAAWARNDRGEGVGVAVIDTGVSPVNDLGSRVVYGPDLSGEATPADTYGHGTVMAGLIAGSGADSATDKDGAHVGMAPAARVIAVKAAGADGVTDVARILRAMHWVSSYRAQLDIRVLNLAWGTASTQRPELDPLNFAVERLWNEGIVVVVAAGNSGPGPSTLTKPADDPLVITVGAYDDRGDTNLHNDTVPRWSSRGPTAAGVAKPDLVAPGRTLVSTRSPGSTVEAQNPKALVGSGYIKGSGTSQAAAVTSGAAALLLAAHPTYTPDQVKAVLTGTASPLRGTAANEAGAGRLSLAPALTADPGPARWQTPVALSDDKPLGDPAAWTGSSWTGSSWTGSSWTGSSWTGSSWTGSSWTGSSWTGSSWTGSSWTGSSWTGSSWTSAFWGDRLGPGRSLPGE